MLVACCFMNDFARSVASRSYPTENFGLSGIPRDYIVSNFSSSIDRAHQSNSAVGVLSYRLVVTALELAVPVAGARR